MTMHCPNCAADLDEHSRVELRCPAHWTPASAGEPPVTDSQFAVLLINADIGEPFPAPALSWREETNPG